MSTEKNENFWRIFFHVFVVGIFFKPVYDDEFFDKLKSFLHKLNFSCRFFTYDSLNDAGFFF